MERDFELEAEIRACRMCPLGDIRVARGGVTVPAEPGAHYQKGGIALLAEAPGANEDAAGRPLVGRAGALLEEMMADAGLTRDSVLLFNRVRCRPPDNNLTDYPEAVLHCSGWLERELDTYSPRVVVLLGATAIRPIFGAKVRVGEVRGTCRNTGGRTFVATYHPAALLRSHDAVTYEQVVADIRLAKELWEVSLVSQTN